MRILKIPKESGLLSLWLATLIYALLEVRTWNLYVLSSLTGSIILLLISDEILGLIASRRFKKLVKLLSGIVFVYTPSLIINPLVLPLAIALLLLVAIIFLSTSPGREVTHGSTIAGSAAVAMHSPILMVSGGALNPVDLMIPPLYSILSTSHASIRVLGWDSRAFISGVAAGISLLLITSQSSSLLMVILVDLVSRLLQEISGLSSKIRVKTYGLIELARSCLTLAVLAMVG